MQIKLTRERSDRPLGGRHGRGSGGGRRRSGGGRLRGRGGRHGSRHDYFCKRKKNENH